MKSKLCIACFLIIGACNSGASSQLTTEDSAQLENAMQEKVKKVSTQLHDDCDSTILQLAQYKADSIRKKQLAVKRKKR